MGGYSIRLPQTNPHTRYACLHKPNRAQKSKALQIRCYAFPPITSHIHTYTGMQIHQMIPIAVLNVCIHTLVHTTVCKLDDSI